MNDPTVNTWNKKHDIEPCDWDDINISNDNYE